jgi:hypothetical protein
MNMSHLERAMFIGAAVALTFGALPLAAQDQERPNILFITTDDIGITNVSAYSRGMAGYRTPNIDRIADEGVLFTD